MGKILRWATAHRNRTVQDVKRVMWSDKWSVEQCKESKQQGVFREPAEKWLSDCIDPKEEDKGNIT